MAVFGNDTPGSQTSTNGASFVVVGKFTLSQNGDVDKLSMYVSGVSLGAPKIKGVIYDDSAGTPNNLLAVGTEEAMLDTFGPDWFDLPFSSPVSLTPGEYWLGYHAGGAVTFTDYHENTGGSRTYKSRDYTLGPMDPYGTPSGSDSLLLSIYASYTPAKQTLLPSADSVDGAWTDQAGGASLFAAIDEATASDTDYIRSEANPSASGCRVKLAVGSDPAVSTGHKIVWRTGKIGNGTINMTVKLYQGGGNAQGGGTLIASFNRNGVGQLRTFTETLSGAEADAITDYTDLYLEFFADEA